MCKLRIALHASSRRLVVRLERGERSCRRGRSRSASILSDRHRLSEAQFWEVIRTAVQAPLDRERVDAATGAP